VKAFWCGLLARRQRAARSSSEARADGVDERDGESDDADDERGGGDHPEDDGDRGDVRGEDREAGEHGECTDDECGDAGEDFERGRCDGAWDAERVGAVLGVVVGVHRHFYLQSTTT
jgi:hypothetical protein